MTFTNSSLATKKKLMTKHYNSRGDHKINKITIHHMAGNLSIEALHNLHSNSREASCNYGIESNGTIGLLLEEKNRSWCSSSPSNDYQAVTIEVANNKLAPTWSVSDEAYKSLIKLCIDICKRNGITKLNYTGDSKGNLTTHKMFTNTNCPGPYLESRMKDIANEVNKVICKKTYSGTLPKVTLRKGMKGTQVMYLQKFLNWAGFNCGLIDGIFGTKTDTSVRDFQKKYGLYVDGIFGPKSLEKAKTIKR